MPKGKANKRYTPEFKIMVVETMQKREVELYNFSYHPNLNQVKDMLNQAFAKIPDDTGLLLHSDEGWQYQHKHYQKMLKDKGIRQSIR